MTQEDKQLLFQDLCARLPYKIKASFIDEYDEGNDSYNSFVEAVDLDGFVTNFDGTQYPIEQVRPYLFPLSSLTVKQKVELYNLRILIEDGFQDTLCEIDFYNKNHFDYRGLIPKDLAIDATNLNIKLGEKL